MVIWVDLDLRLDAFTEEIKFYLGFKKKKKKPKTKRKGKRYQSYLG